MDYTKQFPKGYTKEQQYKAKGIVISLYDFTGEALKPWADDGFNCCLSISEVAQCYIKEEFV